MRVSSQSLHTLFRIKNGRPGDTNCDANHVVNCTIKKCDWQKKIQDKGGWIDDWLSSLPLFLLVFVLLLQVIINARFGTSYWAWGDVKHPSSNGLLSYAWNDSW